MSSAQFTINNSARSLELARNRRRDEENKILQNKTELNKITSPPLDISIPTNKNCEENLKVIEKDKIIQEVSGDNTDECKIDNGECKTCAIGEFVRIIVISLVVLILIILNN